MSIQFQLEVRDVSDGLLPDAVLELSTWTGSGSVTVHAPQVIGATFDFQVTDAVVNVVVSLQHGRFSRLMINLVRNPRENSWRWTDPRIQVRTQGQQVVVRAVMSRIRPAPVTFLEEADLKARAERVKAPLDAAARRRRPAPPETAPLGPLTGALLDRNNFYLRSSMLDQSTFHILAPDPLGSAEQKDWPVNAPGWGRFHTLAQPATPNIDGRVHLIEYGEVGTQKTAPRFLVAVWMPHELAKVGRSAIDFLVWFTPNTAPQKYPLAQYPYTGDYPYALQARGFGTPAEPYFALQPYVELPFAHWGNYHNLAYQMLAAKRSAAIVIPVAPSSNFDLWESPMTLMRMLREICRWIPRDDDGKVPKVHPLPPAVGRVAVAGFSSAVDQLNKLLDRHGAALHYHENVWGSVTDHVQFDRSWRELWSVDGAFHGNLRRHTDFLNKGAQWVRDQNDRRLRIYKNDYTDGRWDPRREQSDGEFARAMKGATCVERGKDDHWAVFCAEPRGRIHALSMSKSFSVSSGVTDAPVWDSKPHENMPRLCLGQAMSTSGFAPLGRP
ncbi:hypothetical protein [Streptomyces sp. NPDC005752]|uniref:hypothetical protein n=1 Tax=Streptomyces sp. NPDC005752 TaxID=3157065 RepID=UPI0033E12896